MARDAKVHSHKREQWSGQAGFILAAIGSAVGLGNIWRFPGVAYENGGGAFLLPYLVALITAGIPILFVDYALGHRFRGSPPAVFRRIRKRAEMLGWFQVAICFVIILYYAVIIAWAGSYAVFSLTTAWGDDAAGFFVGEFIKLPENPDLQFSVVSSVALPLVAVWAVTIVILALGVQRGLEKANLFFIPLLAVLFTALVVRSLFLDGAIDGLNAFFTPNWGALADPGVWLAAYAQIFFSLSIAFGIMLTYSSYLKKKSNLTGTGLVVAFSNSSFEILAGIGVFSALGFMAQAQGVAVGELENITGVMLSFVTFPTLVASMPGGPIFGFLFFASLTVAGLTSLLSLLQVVSGAFQDKFGFSARRSAITIGVVAAVLSFTFFARPDGLHTLDVVDKWTNEVGIVGSAIVMLVLLLSLGQLRTLSQHINAHSSFTVGRIWTVLVGVVVPAVLLWMFISGVINLLSEPYEGYPNWYNNLFGWGSIALMLVLAGTFSLIRWRRPIDEFTPEPTLPGEKIYARAGGAHRGKDES
ncbi:sodium-dependent transporter [Jonesia quinghaiensis]|uniref:sodium-dependent transporter n=1 Tax=Jonesia quinghaiensis TaxID=262806 RepID=UPI0003F6D77A|nr:sodium-dependent transporter [Jonesia quinghaiensis]